MTEVLTTSWHEAGRAEGMQEIIIRLLRRKFGAVTFQTETRVRDIKEKDERDRLADRLIEATSLEELGL